MIELDNGPIAMGIIITIAIVGPLIYSFFVDNHDKPKK